ncbi:hypothetical protein [Amphibacillus jilinensis]|uniref:hypothetical protein n=1 Tax=Amphibacillus jilinensis TaxID=1216008 RepID=UPI00036BF313|nr:hypothetical protein [Amphibacillus jilinensis]
MQVILDIIQKKNFQIIVTILISVTFITYVFIDKRAHMYSRMLAGQTLITEDNIARFTQLRDATSIIELILLMLFVLPIIIFFLAKGDKRDLISLVVKSSLLLGIHILLAYVISEIIDVPSGNLLTPLLPPFSFLMTVWLILCILGIVNFFKKIRVNH